MKNNSFFKSEFPRGLLIGILGAVIFTWIVDPISSWILPRLMKIIGFFTSSFSNSVYGNLSSAMLDTVTLTLTFCVGIACIFSACILFYLKKLNLDYEITTNALLCQLELKENVANGKVDSPKASKELIAQIHKDNKKIRRSNRISYFFTFLCLSVLLVMLMKHTFENNLAAQLTANIEIVSPYVSDKEYKQLKSDLFTIKSKEDYDKLSKSLNAIAIKNYISLKK